jgi:ADYC domain-containing protein
MSLRMSALAVVVLGVGCVNGENDSLRVESVEQDVLTCDEFMCGTNSPQVAEFGFWELNLPSLRSPGLANNVGFRLIGFVQGGLLYLPQVSGGKLTATRTSTSGGTITLSGSALTGGYFYLVNGNRAFEIVVNEVSTVVSWAQPVGAPQVTLESYRLDWTELVNQNPGRFQNVCRHPPIREPSDLLGMVGQDIYHTLLFEGDRIDAVHKLDTAIDTSWFNLGCAGSALAKMALTGHTEAAASAKTLITTLPERQAMLKMLTADYCGDGTPFTVAGQPLNWADDHGTMKLAALLMQPQQPLVREARWTATGAACLDLPRVDAHPTLNSAQELGPDVYDQVLNHCPAHMPPACAGSAFGVDGYHLVTATVPL